MAHPYNKRFRKTRRRESALERLEKRIKVVTAANDNQGKLERLQKEAVQLYKSLGMRP